MVRDRQTTKLTLKLDLDFDTDHPRQLLSLIYGELLSTVIVVVFGIAKVGVTFVMDRIYLFLTLLLWIFCQLSLQLLNLLLKLVFLSQRIRYHILKLFLMTFMDSV